MSEQEDGLSLIVIPDGGGKPRTLRLSRRGLWVLGSVGTVLCVAVVALAASWVPLARGASRADDLARQVRTLTAEQARMDRIAQRLARLEGRHRAYGVRMGVAESEDSALWVPAARASAAGRETLPAGSTATEPTLWPLTVKGVVTRPHLGGAGGDHPGIDIAVASGSYVRASGGGVVLEAGKDPDYGLFVLIDHGNGVHSRYGHASYLVPDRNWTVQQGEIIALSGSTGPSTAPHLHFEILKDGRTIDPLSTVVPP